MKHFLEVDGQTYMATQININPEAKNEFKDRCISIGEHIYLYNAIVARRDRCMEAFLDAMKENKIYAQYSITMKVDGKDVSFPSFAWINEAGFSSHFSSAAYNAMNSALDKLNNVKFGDNPEISITYFLDTVKFTVMESLQVLKAVVVDPACNSNIRLMMVEDAAVKMNSLH